MMGYGLLAKVNPFLPKLLLVTVLITGPEDKLGHMTVILPAGSSLDMHRSLIGKELIEA